MKKLSRSLIKGTNWALGGLLALLGFAGITSCIPRVEYGSPHANFTIKGKVTNEQGAAIPGIQVEVVKYKTDTYQAVDTVYTQSNGDFEWNSSYIAGTNDTTFDIISTDIDGEKNGSYKTDMASVSFKREDLKGGKSWYQGKAEKEITIKLQEKE
jgi:putative lipoprotein (rSAM/lipoprotein system)